MTLTILIHHLVSSNLPLRLGEDLDCDNITVNRAVHIFPSNK